MKHVSILAFENAIASTVIGPMDVFNFSGVLWNFIFNQRTVPCFHAELVSTQTRPISCIGNVVLTPDKTFKEVENPDLIIISAITDIEEILSQYPETIEWLKMCHNKGTHIASICTGVYVLAETGLLDGKTATTHWGFAKDFAEKYPQVHTRPDRLIVDEGDLFSSGGINSGTDLSLYLVEKYYGHEIAVECSKAMVSDFKRPSQEIYSAFHSQKEHSDSGILLVQEWMEKNYQAKFDLELTARNHGMSRRTLERRFKQATGDTPLGYLQKLRVENSKRLMENTLESFDEIASKVGYENAGFFRKVFSRNTGLNPRDYRKRFGMYKN